MMKVDENRESMLAFTGESEIVGKTLCIRKK